jgi:hypothetical protein
MQNLAEEGKRAINFILNKMVIKDSQLLKLIDESYHIQAPGTNYISQIYDNDNCYWFKQHFWEFHLGKDRKEYEFEYVAHAIHDLTKLNSFLIKDTRTNQYSARIEANLDNKRFPKCPLIWFAPTCKINSNEHTDPYDYMNPSYNRYGSIIIKVPLVDLTAGKYYNAFSMGTREFQKQMVTHSILLSNKSHHYFKTSQNDLFVNKLNSINVYRNDILKYERTDNSEKKVWTWTRTRDKEKHNEYKFDALDFCIDSSEITFEKFKLDFIGHNFGHCVKSNCRKVERVDAMRLFLDVFDSNIQCLQNCFDPPVFAELIKLNEEKNLTQ